ncbi:MAG: hypothetical protein J7L53_12380, partial [Deltaproteobacteria bacterium]|nr:hypothetical protein [Deltaproteobacteria bacterium]
KRRLIKVIVFVGIGISVVVLLGVVFLFFLNKQDEVSSPQKLPSYQRPQAIEDGEVLLDPFIILYKQRDGHTGILEAQVSLQVDPRYTSNIQLNMVGIRSLVLDRLTTNIQIYTKKEILEILKTDLIDFGVKDVAFVQYQLM